MGSFIFLIIIFGLMFAGAFIKVVPENTVVIVDRNTHYLKTKTKGCYLCNPKTDKVTTTISTRQLYKSYAENFETHDGKIVRVFFNVRYHTDNIDAVLDSLKSARRSIDDVMNSSVYWAVNNLTYKDFRNKMDILIQEVAPKILSEAIVLNIKIDQFNITNITDVYAQNIKPFKPHLSSHNCGPIRYH